MAATSYANPQALWGTALPKVGNPAAWRARLGNLALVLFLVAQVSDGVLTYVGVITFGIGIEANPLIATLIGYFGAAAALTAAKALAAVLGIALHLRGVHTAVALLTAFYFIVAILPWMVILFPEVVVSA